jgi:CRISPR system Cascade subunit CasC
MITMEAKFVQIHFLTTYPASLLNRDDAGMAKRLPYGGRSRIRVSSQCLKRHWRTAEGEHALSGLDNVDMSVRSRTTFEAKIAKPLITEGLNEQVVRVILGRLQAELLGQSAKATKAKQESSKEPKESLDTSQIIVLGQPEIEYIKFITREVVGSLDTDKEKDAAEKVEAYVKDKAFKENWQALKKAASGGLDAALFGRMVTSDILARCDAAVHVAHAFTVHAEEVESDYFTAVDDLLAESEELGSAHIGETELTSGLFYGYVVVDIPLLVANIGGDRNLAAQIVERLIHLITTVSPGAKLGSTAPYAYAQMLLTEVGARQPRTLAGAFLQPVSLQVPDILTASIAQLGDHLTRFDAMYGNGDVRQIAAMTDISAVPAKDAKSVAQLATHVREAIQQVGT